MSIARTIQPTAAGRLAAAAIALAPALAAAADAPASAAADPHRSTAKCRHHVASTHDLAAVERRGLPVRIRCDGPAHTAAFVQLRWGSPQERAWEEAHDFYDPAIALHRPITLRRAGSRVTRIPLTRKALRFLARWQRIPLTVYGGVERRGTGSYTGTDARRDLVLVR